MFNPYARNKAKPSRTVEKGNRAWRQIEPEHAAVAAVSWGRRLLETDRDCYRTRPAVALARTPAVALARTSAVVDMKKIIRPSKLQKPSMFYVE